MNKLAFSYQKTCGINERDLVATAQELHTVALHMREALGTGYKGAYSFLNLPNDPYALKTVQDLAEQKKKLQPSAIVVVGIGGSSLGTKAVHQACNGLLYNELSTPKIYFADNVDPAYMHNLLACVQAELEQGNGVLVNVISKSGTTTETVANFELLLALLKKYRPDDYHNYVVVTSENHSKLWRIVQHHSFSFLEIPHSVGGRYSVLSPVGLFPLACVGVDVEKLCQGAQDGTASYLTDTWLENDAALNACAIYLHSKNDSTVYDTFVFSSTLAALGAWYRQLMGESVGKEKNEKGTQVRTGLTPTVSVGSNDLHSVGQLYLGGHRHTFFNFITVDDHGAQPQLPQLEEFDVLVANIQGKPLAAIMQAIENGVQHAYEQEGTPFVTTTLPERSAYYVGQWLQGKMIEMVYLAALFRVNPFDQPHVELYKRETRKILKHE